LKKIQDCGAQERNLVHIRAKSSEQENHRLLTRLDSYVKTKKIIHKCGDQKPQQKRGVFRKVLRVGTKFNFNRMKKVNYIALIAAGLAAIAVFLPWVEASSSASFGGYSANYSSGGISGISIGGGILGLLVALAGGFMAFKNIKWAFIAGAVNFINGLGYMLGWFGAGGGASYSSSFGGGSARASVDPQVGLYLFVLASLVFVIFTLKNLKAEKAE
jgi:hypothetical protein